MCQAFWSVLNYDANNAHFDDDDDAGGNDDDDDDDRDDLHCDGCAKLSGLFQLCQFRANVKSGQGGRLPRTLISVVIEFEFDH